MSTKSSFLVLFSGLLLLWTSGCATRHATVPNWNTYSMAMEAKVNASSQPNAPANPPLTDEEKAQRAQYLSKLDSSYIKITGIAEGTLKQLQRRADNYSKFTLGTGVVGIGASVAAGALVVASPANAVWVSALTGIGAGAVSFQTRAALEGFSRDAIARIHNDTLVKFNTAVSEFQTGYESLRINQANVDRAVWDSAAAKAEKALQNYYASALLLPLPTNSDSAEQLKKQNEDLTKQLDEIKTALRDLKK